MVALVAQAQLHPLVVLPFNTLVAVAVALHLVVLVDLVLQAVVQAV